LGNIGLKSGKVSLKVMPFLLISKCSHIEDRTVRSEDIKKTMMASNTAEDVMVLKGDDGKTSYRLKDIGCTESVKNT